jgi:hypothetical protein
MLDFLKLASVLENYGTGNFAVLKKGKITTNNG